MKEFDGAVRPSELIFDSMDMWVRVLDLPMDMMNRAYGELIGNWVGSFIAVDVDEDGMAWGEELRIRTTVRVDQPLLRGVFLPDRDDDGDEEGRKKKGKWFDLQYEKIPHFCFDCGCLVHGEEGCLATDKVKEDDSKQWGEWLRAAPKKIIKQTPAQRSTMSFSGCGSHSTGAESWSKGGGAYVRDIPPRRQLYKHQSFSSSSRTGGSEYRRKYADVTSPAKGRSEKERGAEHTGASPQTDPRKNRNISGTFTRRPRVQGLARLMGIPMRHGVHTLRKDRSDKYGCRCLFRS
jgi:hypothetical protein